MSWQMKASTAALEVMANAFEERSFITIFNLPEMRCIKEANIFRQTEARAELAAAGITLDPSNAATTSAVMAATTVAPAVYDTGEDKD